MCPPLTPPETITPRKTAMAYPALMEKKSPFPPIVTWATAPLPISCRKRKGRVTFANLEEHYFQLGTKHKLTADN